MFELEEYISQGHFFVSLDGDMKKECNAPKDGVGVYLVYQLKEGRIELVYVGSTGVLIRKGQTLINEDGLYGELVCGIQFNQARNISWIKKIKKENIDALDVYWFETFDESFADIPRAVEGRVMQEFFHLHGRLPKWNVEY